DHDLGQGVDGIPAAGHARRIVPLPAMPVPLVPVKALTEAKGRLAPTVGPLQRRLLAIALFEDVLPAPQAVPGLAGPVVVSPDREVWRRADAMGCRVVEEPPGAGDLNRS